MSIVEREHFYNQPENVSDLMLDRNIKRAIINEKLKENLELVFKNKGSTASFDNLMLLLFSNSSENKDTFYNKLLIHVTEHNLLASIEFLYLKNNYKNNITLVPRNATYIRKLLKELKIKKRDMKWRTFDCPVNAFKEMKMKRTP